MRYQGIIFDLDGVLISTDHYHYQAWKQIADKLGLNFSEEMNNQLRGVSRNESFEIILNNNNKMLSDEEKNQYLEEKNNIYISYLEKMSPKDLDQDVLNVLNTIKNAGIKIAIGSSSKNAKLILKKIAILELFDFISDGTNIKKSKPDPEVFLNAAIGLKLNMNNCLVVDDAFSGVDAALKAGMDVCGIGDANNHIMVTYKINKFKELLKIVIS